MDALRYLCLSGLHAATQDPLQYEKYAKSTARTRQVVSVDPDPYREL